MSIPSLEWAKELRECGKKLGREGLSKRVIKLVGDFDGSYKGAMILAGRLKAIAQAAKFDEYWSEKVSMGFHAERGELDCPIEQYIRGSSNA